MKINLRKSRIVKRKYNGQEFEIKPYITLIEKKAILTEAYKSYLSRVEESGGLVEAIIGLDADIQMMIVGLCVKDIEVDNEEITYEDLLNSGFLYLVLKEVVNYQDIRNSAHDLIRMFVICERIPDVNELSSLNMAGLEKETVEDLTEIVKNIA